MALAATVATAAMAGTGHCPPPALRFEPVAPGLWWVPGQPGTADAQNRGHVVHLLIGVEGPRVWALGSGPSAAFGATLRCQVRAHFQRDITDVIAPWPQPEAVLGQRGLPGARTWAHASVAAAMAQRCDDCVRRLRGRLDTAADDLGPQPVRLPQRQLQGEQGQLGPWRWWRLQRAQDVPVTVWQWRRSDLAFAPGLVADTGTPDGRDADLEQLQAALLVLPKLHRQSPAVARWLGAQGPIAEEPALAAQAAYWSALLQAADQALERGDDPSAPAPVLPGWESMSEGPQHALNWQRAWRQSESRSFQRSRR